MGGFIGHKLYVSMAALFLVNLVPIIGVLYWGWNVGMVLGLYWIENLIIGLLNVPKILMARDDINVKIGKSLFFTVHFGIFCAVHGAFIQQLFLNGDNPLMLLSEAALRLTLIGLFLSHLMSFLVNFIGGREFENRTAREQMSRPYQRIMVLHIVILAGGFLVVSLGQPALALVLLVAIKIGLDLRSHWAEHRLGIAQNNGALGL